MYREPAIILFSLLLPPTPSPSIPSPTPRPPDHPTRPLAHVAVALGPRRFSGPAAAREASQSWEADFGKFLGGSWGVSCQARGHSPLNVFKRALCSCRPWRRSRHLPPTIQIYEDPRMFRNAYSIIRERAEFFNIFEFSSSLYGADPSQLHSHESNSPSVSRGETSMRDELNYFVQKVTGLVTGKSFAIVYRRARARAHTHTHTHTYT
jgi:hypothetical protein